MRIAVIGTGISGLVASYLLADDHDLTVFEANDYIGGHTHTVKVDDPSGPTNVDTGFIVYNEWTYPNFCKLLDRLGVETQASNMSFSVRDDAADIEYKGDNLNTLFAQRSNFLRWGHYRMLYEILRFYRQSRRLLNRSADGLTMGNYLRQERYSTEFIERHLIPMGAAIWSADPNQFYDFPAAYFVRFCHNHGMLNILRRPQWRVIRGGSLQYVRKITAPFHSRIRLSTPVKTIKRQPDSVEVTSERFGTERFDQVIIAAHSDQALRMLADPTPSETEVLGKMRYQRNDVALHHDTSCLPHRRKAWSSWNYHIPKTRQSTAIVTYNMNELQSLGTDRTYCVTLNASEHIDEKKCLRQLRYDHPVYTTDSVLAQKRHSEISGVHRTHYCGAYWGYGFHEDGVNSGLTVCKQFGKGL
ncbi:MAG: amine oxidase [Phycisphaerae bacterium]|nr:MAG: amine oxidase [Phycisphaerae bacterium]